MNDNKRDDRAPYTKAHDEWLESQDGKDAQDEMRRKLRRAFKAGWSAGVRFARESSESE